MNEGALCHRRCMLEGSAVEQRNDQKKGERKKKKKKKERKKRKGEGGKEGEKTRLLIATSITPFLLSNWSIHAG